MTSSGIGVWPSKLVGSLNCSEMNELRFRAGLARASQTVPRRGYPMRAMIALLLGAAVLVPAAQARTDAVQVDPADWPRYARDLGGTRYSPLADINAGNVENLDQAWSYRLRPEGGAGILGGTVPIVIDGIMYL